MRFKESEMGNSIRNDALAMADDIVVLLNSNFTWHEIQPMLEKRAAELAFVCSNHIADSGKKVYPNCGAKMGGSPRE